MFLVTVLLLGVSFSSGLPLFAQEEVDVTSSNVHQAGERSSSYIVSPASGWTTGGEEITISGSGFSNLAFSNTTDDGINHQWVESTMDYSDQAGTMERR